MKPLPQSAINLFITFKIFSCCHLLLLYYYYYHYYFYYYYYCDKNTYKISLPSKFLGVIYSIVNSRHYIIQVISWTYPSCITLMPSWWGFFPYGLMGDCHHGNVSWNTSCVYSMCELPSLGGIYFNGEILSSKNYPFHIYIFSGEQEKICFDWRVHYIIWFPPSLGVGLAQIPSSR